MASFNSPHSAPHSVTLVMDTSGLVAVLEECGRADLIRHLLTIYGEIAVPASVKKEFEVENYILGVCAEQMLVRILPVVSPEKIEVFMVDNPKLGEGESDVILSCQRLREKGVDAVCVLDDKNARKAAKAAGLDVVGVLGLLNAVEDGGFLSPSEKREAVKRIRDSGFYLPSDASDPRHGR